MKRAILRCFILTGAVWAAAVIVPGIRYDSWQSLFVAGAVLGILNAVLKPLLQILSLPFILLTFGVFLLVINAILLRLTAWIVSGFHVSGFWAAMGGSLVISVVTLLLGYRDSRGRFTVSRTVTLFSNRSRPPPGKGPIIDV